MRYDEAAEASPGPGLLDTLYESLDGLRDRMADVNERLGSFERRHIGLAPTASAAGRVSANKEAEACSSTVLRATVMSLHDLMDDISARVVHIQQEI